MAYIIVPSSITIVVFLLSYLSTKKAYQQSIQQLKTEKQLADLYGILDDVFRFLDLLTLLYKKPKTLPEDFDILKDKITSTVRCAGTVDAVNILVHQNQMINSGLDDQIEVTTSRLIAGYVLLAMQIKYDVTGVENSPLTWYTGKFTTQKVLEQSTFYEDSIVAINEIVDQLKLKPFLRISDM